MSDFMVLIVAGTHGNEINAPWLINKWLKDPGLIKTNNLKFTAIIGNPKAIDFGTRYIDRDLNRSFNSELLCSNNKKDYEVLRAIELLKTYGYRGRQPCDIVIDLHSTTSAMGSCLVVYGRRPADLALASLIQSQLGLPIYLHEADIKQTGFLVESWPCGLVVEIGPVPQLLMKHKIINQNHIALEVIFDVISKAKIGKINFPESIVIYRHLGSIDFPRDCEGNIDACLHPDRQDRDWHSMRKGDPLFIRPNGKVIRYQKDEIVFPVFINEAAYAEKNIAMSLTKREVWDCSSEWERALNKIIN